MTMQGKRHTEESKRKISEAQNGRKHSAETRWKLSDAKMGRKHTEETKRKMSLSAKAGGGQGEDERRQDGCG